jgi:hypothetical protein
VVQHGETHHRVERRVGERQRGTVTMLDINLAGELGAQVSGQRRVDLDGGEPAGSLGQPARRHAVARSDLQHVAIEGHRLQRPRQQLGLRPVSPVVRATQAAMDRVHRHSRTLGEVSARPEPCFAL